MRMPYMNSDLEVKIMEVVDKITGLYDGREDRIPELAKKLDVSVEDIRKTLKVCNYSHTIKRTPENALQGQLINGVISPDKFPFLEKYIGRE